MEGERVTWRTRSVQCRIVASCKVSCMYVSTCERALALR
jgi:hypothetical protein